MKIILAIAGGFVAGCIASKMYITYKKNMDAKGTSAVNSSEPVKPIESNPK